MTIFFNQSGVNSHERYFRVFFEIGWIKQNVTMPGELKAILSSPKSPVLTARRIPELRTLGDVDT
jgi:hypothetical protein